MATEARMIEPRSQNDAMEAQLVRQWRDELARLSLTAALLHERYGHELHKNQNGIAAVDAELTRLGFADVEEARAEAAKLNEVEGSRPNFAAMRQQAQEDEQPAYVRALLREREDAIRRDFPPETLAAINAELTRVGAFHLETMMAHAKENPVAPVDARAEPPATRASRRPARVRAERRRSNPWLSGCPETRPD
jgi:hypothetical protein